jgi:hypothetical protein
MIIPENSYRHRVLDTRAKFILLHDHRLFHSSLHYLWKKIVNVIFLRQHDRHHGSVLLSHQNIHPWYDISTVPFPSPIRNTFLLHHLDTWHQGKFHSGADLFREKTSDLRGQQLRVVTFQHLPASIKMANPLLRMDSLVDNIGPTSFGGLEIEVCVKNSKKYFRTAKTKKIFIFFHEPVSYHKDIQTSVCKLCKKYFLPTCNFLNLFNMDPWVSAHLS